jgi:hypothetical protein
MMCCLARHRCLAVVVGCGLLLLGRVLPTTAQTQAVIVGTVPLTFSSIAGEATDAQIPNLNLLGTGLTPSRCVETATDGRLSVAAGACGGGSGTPGGTPGQFQWNNAGVFGGAGGLLYDPTDTTLFTGQGLKVMPSGLSANYQNSVMGNDINFRRPVDLGYTTESCV